MSKTKQNGNLVTEALRAEFNQRRVASPLVEAKIESFIVFHKDNEAKKDAAAKQLFMQVIDGAKPISELDGYKVLVYVVGLAHGMRVNATTLAESALSTSTNSRTIYTRNFRGKVMTSVAGDIVIGRDTDGNDVVTEIKTGTCQVVGEYTFTDSAREQALKTALETISASERLDIVKQLMM